ncbi:MAG: AI-2E family transporter [Planctomycetales bacterium]|nr:AI-2E family transporter [Planctomycetales bacterium]
MPTSISTNFLRVPALLITVFGVIGALYFGKELLLPLALASLLSFLLTPLVKYLDRLGIPRVMGVVLVVVAVFTGLGGLGWVVTGQLINLSDNLPQYRGNLIEKARALHHVAGDRLTKATETLDDIREELAKEGDEETADAASAEEQLKPTSKGLWERLTETVGSDTVGLSDSNERAVEVRVVELPPSPLAQIEDWLGPLVAPLSTAGVVIVLVIFMLIGREDLRDRILLLVGRRHLQATTEALDDATTRLSKYLRMQLLINASYGGLVALGLYVIGLPNALLWGVLATMLRFLPYLGPWLAAIMPIALSLAVFDSWTFPVMTMGLFVVLELIVNNVFEPYLYGSSIGVSSLGIIVAAIFWTWLWGPVGLVLAMPLTVCMVVMGNYMPSLRFLSILMSDKTQLGADIRHYQRVLAMDGDEADEIADAFTREYTFGETYDQILIPSLSMLGADLQSGQLRDEQEEFGLGLLKEYAAEDERDIRRAREKDTLVLESRPAHHDSIVCFPANDEIDQRAGELLRNLLLERGLEMTVASTERLASERIDDVKRHETRVVVISAMQASSSRHARYLVKRLRAACPDITIIVGLWGQGAGGERTRERALSSGATDVAFELATAVSQVECRLRLTSGPTARSTADATPAVA